MIELILVEQTIINEIEKGATQKQVAQTYALGLASSWPTEWWKVNAAIEERWESPTALERIITMAWKIYEQRGN